MFGARDGAAPKVEPPTHGERGSQPFRTVRDAIHDLRDNPGPHSEYTPDVAKYFALVPPGGNWRNLPKDLQRDALGKASYEAGGGKTGFYRRLAWDSLAPTITGRANRKGRRCVTPMRSGRCPCGNARLQGFPDDWQFTGAMNRQYMQVGNAVPVHLGAVIGRAISRNCSCEAARDGFSAHLEIALDKAVERLRSSARNKRGKDEQHPTLF